MFDATLYRGDRSPALDGQLQRLVGRRTWLGSLGSERLGGVPRQRLELARFERELTVNAPRVRAAQIVGDGDTERDVAGTVSGELES